MINENERITREVNEVLIDRIRKYQSQDITQLLNSPNDEDTSNSYLGGLINFVGDDTYNLDDEINNDLDKISINDIFIEPQPDNEYNNELTEDEEEENEERKKKENKNKIKIDNIKNDTNKVAQEESSFINPFIIKKNNTNGIRILLTENFNNYFDLIGKNYEKYDNNHFPKIIVNDKNNTKKIMLKNLREKIYYTKEGEKIIINEEIYESSLAYLKNKEIYSNIPERYKKNNKDYTLDFNLLDETIDNIQIKSFELIEINKLVSTSMSKITLYCTQLNKYVKDKLEPFNNSINSSYEKLNNKKIIITKIKEKTLMNSGEIILKKIKMNNCIKLVNKLKKYANIKSIMNNLETLITDPKNYQKTFDLINKCQEEIDIIKNENKKYIDKKLSHELKEKSQKHSEKKLLKVLKEQLKKEESKELEIIDSLVDLYEKKLIEFRNENDAHMSGELSQLLNNYFYNFLILDNENEVNIDKNEKMKQFENYNISKFVLEKISSFSEKHSSMLTSLSFPSPKKELEKMDVISNYYIESNLIVKVYNQLRNIFTTLCDEVMNKIIIILNDKMNSNNENIEEDKDEIKLENGGENEKKESDKIDGSNDNNEMCLLLCLLLSKNKLNETILSFIDILLTKLEKYEKIENNIKENIIKEIQEIKILVKNNIHKKVLTQIQKCLHTISSCDNIDLYINNYYLTLEMLHNEIPNYIIIEENNNQNDNNNNNNELGELIIEEQKYFIENWSKKHLSKFDSEIYKSWDFIKEIPSRYQNILNVFFNFDINNNCMKDELIITKFPSDKIKLIKDAEEEEEENYNSLTDINKDLLTIKDGEKPEMKIKITQISLEIIKSSFELLKMFTIFHKECYGFILENFTKIIIYHLNYQIDQIYGGKCGFSVSQQEISMTYAIFLLIEYVYEHIKNNDFFVTVAENSDQKIYDNYLDVNKNIKDCCDLSKNKIEDLIENNCISETLNKLQEIKLPYYNVISGDIPVNEYALYYVSSLKDIYNSMINCYEDKFMKEIINKSLDDFFDKFEDYILHGKKIEDENCLKQFKRDMVFLKKNLVFIDIMDISEIKDRIDNINKSVLPEWMRGKKK